MYGLQRRFSKMFNWFLSAALTYLYRYTRPAIKWLLRKTTGLCELQRTCYYEPAGAPRIIGVEESLIKSKNGEVQRLLHYLERAATEKRFNDENAQSIIKNTTQAILSIKKIRPDIHQPFKKSFGECVSIIWGNKQLLVELEGLRTTAYDAENSAHEKKLLELWELLMPGRKLESRVSSNWKDLGFQGEDPKTDFRGMGLLGLENLLHFAQNYKNAALHVLSHSHHPKYGYSFAIVGINLTHLAYNLWKDGTVKTHAYNLLNSQQFIPTVSRPAVLHFHRFYCFLFFEFDKLWMTEKPPTIMEFSRIRDKFEKDIRSQLADPSCLFKLNFPVDHI